MTRHIEISEQFARDLNTYRVLIYDKNRTRRLFKRLLVDKRYMYNVLLIQKKRNSTTKTSSYQIFYQI